MYSKWLYNSFLMSVNKVLTNILVQISLCFLKASIIVFVCTILKLILLNIKKSLKTIKVVQSFLQR